MDENSSVLVALGLGCLFAVTMLVLRQLQVVHGRSVRLRGAAMASLVGFGFGLSGYIAFARDAHGASAGLLALACFGPLFAASVGLRVWRRARR